MKYFSTVIFVLLLVSCQDDVTKLNEQLILGKWKGDTWLVNDKPSSDYNASAVRFEFTEDNSFRSSFGNQQEEGIYRVVRDKLFTEADGRSEISVKLEYLSPDSCVMGMNRGGQMETLVLVKQ